MLRGVPLQQAADDAGMLLGKGAAGAVDGENAAVVKVLHEILPRRELAAKPVPVKVHRPVQFRRGSAVRGDRGGETLGGTHGHAEPRREHRIHKAERIADHRPARAGAARGDELVVGIRRHGRNAPPVRGRRRQPRIVRDGFLQLLRGRRAKTLRALLRQHHPDGKPRAG